MKDNTVNITVRVDRETRDEFVKTAKSNDMDASKLIRAYMKKYIEESKK